ncbi:Rieske (2Fe-2S) protein [Streptomyces roseoviridis]|uniref:Cytochrome bc1 complex Rieske iron-sulfur subunit n=1 Tax=Streptomyces roseoviridis TaxID=67361 RepID=A0ABV5QHN6_9ACTN
MTTADALPRRTALLAGAVLVTGCGSNGSDGTDRTNGTREETTASTPAAPTSGAPTPVEPSPPADALARTSDIPVGGGRVFKDRKVVVTQPSAGEFRAFSAVCTHQGCLVGKVADGTIDCPCHGSRFHVADGSVAAGPATRPLPAETINVSAGTITLA